MADERINKAGFIDTVAARLDGDRKAATAAVEGFIESVYQHVAKGQKVVLTGFGSFEKRVRPARTARNPATGATVKVKKTAVPAFKAGAQFKSYASGAAKPTPPAKKAPVAKATAAKAAPAKKAAASTTAPAKKASATKASATKASATKSSATKASATKASATKATPAKTATPAKNAPAKKAAAATTAPAKKSAATKASATKATPAKKAPAKKTT